MAFTKDPAWYDLYEHNIDCNGHPVIPTGDFDRVTLQGYDRMNPEHVDLYNKALAMVAARGGKVIIGNTLRGASSVVGYYDELSMEPHTAEAAGIDSLNLAANTVQEVTQAPVEPTQPAEVVLVGFSDALERVAINLTDREIEVAKFFYAQALSDTAIFTANFVKNLQEGSDYLFSSCR